VEKVSGESLKNSVEGMRTPIDNLKNKCDSDMLLSDNEACDWGLVQQKLEDIVNIIGDTNSTIDTNVNIMNEVIAKYFGGNA